MSERQDAIEDQDDDPTIRAVGARNGGDRCRTRHMEGASFRWRRDGRCRCDVCSDLRRLSEEGIRLSQTVIRDGSLIRSRRSVTGCCLGQ